MVYPVIINNTICIPNSNNNQKPMYQESIIINQDEPTKKNEDRATIKVKISAKIKASGIFFLKKSVKI